MSINDWALILAGGIGTFVGIAHGIIVQKSMVLPIFRDTRYPLRLRRIVAVLLQFSTYCWVLGGLALMTSPKLLNASSTLTLAIVVAAFYTFGALGNFWGTQGKHPGWFLLAISVGLIVFGIGV